MRPRSETKRNYNLLLIRSFPRREILGQEHLLQIVFLPAVTIRHKDSVLIMGDHLDHLRGGVLLVVLTDIGRVGVEGVGGVWGWGAVGMLGVLLAGL